MGSTDTDKGRPPVKQQIPREAAPVSPAIPRQGGFEWQQTARLASKHIRNHMLKGSVTQHVMGCQILVGQASNLTGAMLPGTSMRWLSY